MRLEDKDILQIDATVTTGLLIFLTISFIETPSSDAVQPLFTDISTRLMITITMLSPFVFSAAILLAMDGEARIATEPLRRTARMATAFGFALIFATLVGTFIALQISRLPSS